MSIATVENMSNLDEARQAMLAVMILATRHAPAAIEDRVMQMVSQDAGDVLELTVTRAVAAASGGHQALVAKILNSAPVAIEETEALAEGLTGMLTGQSDWPMAIRAALVNTNDAGTRDLAQGLLSLAGQD